MTASKAKGSHGEREAALLFGEGSKRAPLSGALGGMGDLVFPPGSIWRDWVVEVKRRKAIGGVAVKDALHQAEASIGIGGKRRPMVLMREDHGPWYAFMYAEDIINWCKALNEMGNTGKIKALIRQMEALLRQMGEGL